MGCFKQGLCPFKPSRSQLVSPPDLEYAAHSETDYVLGQRRLFQDRHPRYCRHAAVDCPILREVKVKPAPDSVFCSGFRFYNLASAIVGGSELRIYAFRPIRDTVPAFNNQLRDDSGILPVVLPLGIVIHFLTVFHMLRRYRYHGHCLIHTVVRKVKPVMSRGFHANDDLLLCQRYCQFRHHFLEGFESFQRIRKEECFPGDLDPVAFESPRVVLFASDINSYYDGPFGRLPDLVVLSIMHLVPLL